MALSVTCRLWATGLATGERSDTETVTLRSERGDWKKGYLKIVPRQSPTQLNVQHPFLNREANTTGVLLTIDGTVECAVRHICFPPGFRSLARCFL